MGKVRLGAALAPEDLLAQASEADGEGLPSRLFGLYFQDTGHSGQAEPPCQLASTNRRVLTQSGESLCEKPGVMYARSRSCDHTNLKCETTTLDFDTQSGQQTAPARGG